MDVAIQRALNDKIYDKRKQGALELESVIRDSIVVGDHKRIAAIVDQLCHDYAYAWQQPHARNGGLIGLAAAAIALGSDHVAQYLKAIVPPVLACFTDQDARVRYYACESMYNIAKVAKGEILVFFNDVFDALCKLAADSELSVKNGAELLDRLVKDIVSESAATYVSTVLPEDEGKKAADDATDPMGSSVYYPPTAFSLPKFIPLLRERIYVLNPWTRNFLVSWVVLLDTIPDLYLVTYLPDFLGGFLKFLNDANHDVKVMTQNALDRFLEDIIRINRVKCGIAERRRNRAERREKTQQEAETAETAEGAESAEMAGSGSMDDASVQHGEGDFSAAESSDEDDGDWIPGQDTYVDYPRILATLVESLDPAAEGEIRLTSLRWIDAFFDVCPEEILPFVPKLLSQVLPAMASSHEQVRQMASKVNGSLMEYMSTLPDEDSPETHRPPPLSRLTTATFKTADERPSPVSSANQPLPAGSTDDVSSSKPLESRADLSLSQSQFQSEALSQSQQPTDLDYRAAVGALTLHFLADHEATRVAALNWLILLHRKAPRKVLATNDGTFPALLKTLSDPDEAVVTKDLQLLAQISRNSDDSYFSSFIENVLQLFGTDRKLLEQRGNLIIRQLCGSLNAERIFRTMADCLEREEDLEFATTMVQSLNNNLITAPQLADLRRRLRNLDNRDGQTLFVTLFKSWCYNAVATFSLCLLSQAYEQAYQLLLTMGELETTVQMLIEIDKLIQLLESPVFTYLRLQLLEPERYPYLYKCMYGLLMLLPQSAAFAALKNRLGSVSAIGYLHTPGRQSGPPSFLTSNSFNNPSSAQAGRIASESTRGGNTSQSAGSLQSAVGGARHKSRDEGAPIVRWPELLDKFRAVQERARRLRKGPLYFAEGNEGMGDDVDDSTRGANSASQSRVMIDDAVSRALPSHTVAGGAAGGAGAGASAGGATAAGKGGVGAPQTAHKKGPSLGNLTRMARNVAQKKR